MTPMNLLTSLVLPDDLDRAVVVGDDVLSRHGLLDRATRLAAGLPEDGPVAVHASPTLETVVGVVAGLLAGVPVVPVPPDSGPSELRHLLTDSGATAWIGPSVDGVDLPPVRPGAGGPPARTGEGPAMILYTSGTTGAPKGVELSSSALAAGIDALADAWAWTPDDTVVHGLPLFHTHGLILGVLGSLRIGSRVAHTGRPTPSAYAATPGSMYFGVPTVWNRIAADEPAAQSLAGARLIVSGSAPLPVSLFEQLAHLMGQSPVERYGMTETMITLSTRADGERRPGWVGEPVRDVEARLVTETGHEVPADGETIGRLQVRGPLLFDGYLGRPEATAESFTDDGWFRTGDVAVHDATGFHRIVGRESTDLIKSGGYRIGSGEVEAALLDHPAVAEAAVVGVADDDLGQRIVAFVVLRGSRSTGIEDALVEHVASQLSWHKRPRQVVVLDALPRNPMGKVQKTLLG